MTTPQGTGMVVPLQRKPATADFAGAIGEANRILDEFGFSAPPVNPVTIARELGVKVSFVSMPRHPNVSGFYDAQDDAIYIAKGEYPKRQTFTIAHELGHRLLHREWAASNDYRVMLRDPSLMIIDEKEQAANAFAAHLLVPRDMLDEYRHVASIEELSRLFVVSMPVIRNRLRREFGAWHVRAQGGHRGTGRSRSRSQIGRVRLIGNA